MYLKLKIVIVYPFILVWCTSDVALCKFEGKGVRVFVWRCVCLGGVGGVAGREAGGVYLRDDCVCDFILFSCSLC